MKKKLISALLTLCMVLSLLPVSALAVDPTIAVTTGKMEDHPKDSTTAPITTLCKANSYKVVDVGTEADGKISVTVEAKQIVEHSNGRGDPGYWIGATFTPEGSGYVILYTTNNGTNWLVDTDSCTDGSIVSLYIDAFKDNTLNTDGGSITVGVFSKSAVSIAEGTADVTGAGQPLTTKTYTVKASEGCTKAGDVESVTIGAINVEAGKSLPETVGVTSDPAGSVTTPAEISWAEKGVSGGDAPETATAGKTYTATITVEPKEGYTLADETVYTIGSEAVKEGDVKVDASGTATLTKEFAVPSAEFTVTFNYNYDNAPASTTAPTTNGGKVTKPDNPTRDDYTFGGWYKEAACTNQFNFDTETITADTTLYAKWTENVTPTPTKYTVSFNSGDGTGTMAAVTVEKAATGDTTYTLPECAFTAPSGKTFAGWKVGDANGVQPAGAVVTLTADTTMTATWADEVKADDAPVEVTNNTATATVTAPETVKAGDVVTIDASKDKAGNEITANVTSSEIQLPKEAVDTLKDASSVEITTPTGTVTLPQAALTTIANDTNVTSTAPATLTVAQTSEEATVTPPSTSTEVKATFEVKVSVGNHEIELSASDLNNQFIKLALNIGRGLTNPSVYYVEDNGTLGAMLGVGKAYNPTDGSITVLAPHLSNFAVVASKQTTGDLALTSGVKEGNFVSTTLTGMTAGNYYLVQTRTDSSHFTFITFKAQDTSMKFTVNSGNTVEVWESKTDITFNGYVPTTDGTGHVDATTITAAN